MSAHRPTFPVRPEKAEALRHRMESLGITERDLEESFFRSAAAQRAGKRVESGVEIFHPPSGLRVRCSKSRSQALNRFLARRELVRRFEHPVAFSSEGSNSAPLSFPVSTGHLPFDQFTRLFAWQPDAPHLSRLRDLYRSTDDRPHSRTSERPRDARPPEVPEG